MRSSTGGPHVDAFGDEPGGLIIPAEVSGRSVNPVRPPYLRGHSMTREFHVRGCGWGDLITAALVEFPSWQAAVQAGYDGCAHCQKQFSVSAYGELRMKVVHPPGAEPGPVTFTGTYAGQTVRFGIPLNPPPEQMTGEAFEAGGVLYHLAAFSHIVPGQRDIVIRRGSWSVSGRVKVERRWRDSEGHTHGNTTEVTATLGQPGLHITPPT